MRQAIEAVSIKNSISGYSTEDDNCWDVSDSQNETVLAWYTDEEHDGFYEVTIGAENGMKANENSSYLFYYIGYQGDNTNCISGLSYLDTSMSYMFCYCGRIKITNLELGNKFNTSKGTDMSKMFYGTYGLRYLDLGAMSFETVENYEDIFTSCGDASCIIYAKNTPSQTFVLMNKNPVWSDSNILIK